MSFIKRSNLQKRNLKTSTHTDRQMFVCRELILRCSELWKIFVSMLRENVGLEIDLSFNEEDTARDLK
jgi:hypothetical protein